jgi:hypothetical protein
MTFHGKTLIQHASILTNSQRASHALRSALLPSSLLSTLSQPRWHVRAHACGEIRPRPCGIWVRPVAPKHGNPAAYPRRQVRAVRLRRDRIVVALEHKVLVYNFADLKLLHQTETCANPRGLVAISSTAAMSTTSDNTVLACPGLHTGQVRAGTARGRHVGRSNPSGGLDAG